MLSPILGIWLHFCLNQANALITIGLCIGSPTECGGRFIIIASLIACHCHQYFVSGSSFSVDQLNAKFVARSYIVDPMECNGELVFHVIQEKNYCTYSYNIYTLSCLAFCWLGALDQLLTSNFSGMAILAVKVSQNFMMMAFLILTRCTAVP